MALINCPECGKEISDKAGACPNCGCPIGESNNVGTEAIQQVELARIKVKKKTKVFVVFLIILIILGAAGAVGYKLYTDHKAEQEYQQAYNTYIDNLEAVRLMMIMGGSDAEGLCNLTAKVWYNTIHEVYDTETDKYTKYSKTIFNPDFSTSIDNLYSDDSTKTTLANIESNQSTVKSYIKDLQYPPEGLEKCNEAVTKMYEAYKTLTDLAINPTGSYTSFSSNKNAAITDFMSAYEQLDNLIPEKISETK